ncbi:MAG: iron-sulfur cluster repair di-iron protein [Victivallaceae bacterium]|nr:iron-sulfur cluster repair di-iron protein [Victivallaceae bacterium]
MNKLRNKPIGQIVAENLTTAGVFEAHGMDFCCHGAQTLESVCKDHHVAVKQIESELSASIQSPPQDYSDINVMKLNELTHHIVTVHHLYTKKMLPVIAKHLDTVVKVHGVNHPALFDIRKNFISLREELEPHLEKEEKSIFPYIDALATNIPLPSVDFHKISQPIILLEQEHENAGRIFDDINNLAQGYKPPADACNTYRLVLRELQELEQDLHLHIAQENYLLFPKAIKCEQERLQKC